MRTTVTLEPDAVALLERSMRERGVSFKQAVNDAIRAGLAPRRSQRYRVAVRPMGTPVVPLTRALALAGEIEDEEIVRKLQLGK